MARPDHPSLNAPQRMALVSIGAAAFLVVLKLVTGLVSGSLGLLAEAAHSGTDLVAAVLTFWALRVAARPADDDHPFGHGKAEHLAALGEASFLVAVSALIGYQAVSRLVGNGTHEVHADWYTFVVVAVVLCVDVSRATLSLRASRRHHSAALASNALHFASDFVGTLAVMAGLVLTREGHPAGDAAAGTVVAVLVIGAAVTLIRANVRVLMDEAPEGAEETVRQAIARVEPRAVVDRLRVRQAAGRHFIDMVLGVAPDAALGQGHAVADTIEEAIRGALPGSDVTVHVEPRDSDDLRERATGAALSVRNVREVHNVRIVMLDGRTDLSLHLKLPPAESLGDAHEVADLVEQAICHHVPEIDSVHVHLEPLSPPTAAEQATADEHGDLEPRIAEIAREVSGATISGVRLHREARGLVANLTLLLPAEQTLAEAHHIAGNIEEAIRRRCPDLAEIVVHTEPEPARSV